MTISKTFCLIVLGASLSTLSAPAFAQSNPFGLPLNDYQCYRVLESSGDVKNRNIKVQDQFGEYGQFIAQPVLVCNPVSIDGERIADEKVHYACYNTDPNNNSDLKSQTVLIQNRFGEQKVQLAPVSQLVCVPSVKEH